MQLEMFSEAEAPTPDATGRKPMQAYRAGDWEVRDFHGFFQAREIGNKTWRFHVVGFGPQDSAGTSDAHLMKSDQSCHTVKMNRNGRFVLNGIQYGDRDWSH